MRHCWTISFLVIIGCSVKRDKIIVPVVTESFYQQAFDRIDKQLKVDQSNFNLVEQKIFYCDQLEWPTNCINALDEYKRQKGMNPVLLDQYVNYFRNHKRHQLMLDLLNRWEDNLEPLEDYTKERIRAFTFLRRSQEAKLLLRNYLSEHQSISDYQFASEMYVELRDTLMASYMLGKLYQSQPDDPLVYEQYAPILWNLGYTDIALKLYEEETEINPTNYELHIGLSSKYESLDMLSSARKAIESFTERDTVIYRIAELYLSELMWDSAHLYVDQIISRDSLNRKAWWTKARMYEDRGWLSYSLNYYNHLIYLDSLDTAAVQRASLVRRKIAYLQRQKFEEQKLAPLELERKQ